MKHSYHKKILANVPAETIIDTLQPLILEPRSLRVEQVLQNRLEGIHLVFESPADVHNAIAALRSAEAFGVANLHIIAPENETMYAKTISQSAIYWVNLHYHATWADFMAQLPTKRPYIAGAKMDGDLELAELPVEQPLYLLFGNEHRGLSEQANKACNTSYRIPMQGMSESLNLSVSASISLYDTTRRRRQHLESTGDLSKASYDALKAKYYLNSVSSRFLPTLFPKE
jgi:tRNA (guanosine-2'-O-)-methyltransferase